jgi:dynactin complex subunit
MIKTDYILAIKRSANSFEIEENIRIGDCLKIFYFKNLCHRITTLNLEHTYFIGTFQYYWDYKSLEI